MNRELLLQGLGQLGVVAERAVAGIEAYVAAVEADNPALGLVGAEGDELVVKHILDSLAPLALLDGIVAGLGDSLRGGRPRVADFGTGAGLPGLPLALARPEWDFDLVDRMSRRTQFLERTLASLDAPNARVVEGQVEHAKGPYDLIVCRAFRPFERKLFKKVFGALRPRGFLCAYKGRAERARAELPQIEGLYGSVRIEPVRVPFLDDERCLAILSRPPAAPTISRPDE